MGDAVVVRPGKDKESFDVFEIQPAEAEDGSQVSIKSPVGTYSLRQLEAQEALINAAMTDLEGQLDILSERIAAVKKAGAKDDSDALPASQITKP